MPGRGHRVFATHSIEVSTTVNAPLGYVYDWCTDYRTDDWKVSGSGRRPRFRVLRPSPRRVIRMRFSPEKSKDPAIALELIRLEPPDAWHLDQIDETDRQTIDYKLTALGPAKTRLDLHITERWVVPKHPTRKEYQERTKEVWNQFVGFLELRYRSGRPAKG